MMSSTTNWFDLPLDLKINILSRIDPVEILVNTQKVCTDWYKVCKDPSMWKVINLCVLMDHYDVSYTERMKMCKHVVDRSQGQLVEVIFPRFLLPNDVLMYIAADRASQLKRLIMYIGSGASNDLSMKSLPEALKKFPLLEELDVDFCHLSKEVIESLGRYCTRLKKLNYIEEGPFGSSLILDDELAVCIGENLHELRHLELYNNGISNIGLKVILDGCRQLETLDLGMCEHIDLNGDVVKRASEQIKHLTLPNPNCILRPLGVEYSDTDTEDDN
ncbi:putative F-box/LRR-repeat protein 23 [Rutidosis leptorrhynchoides]|uniref:putative F-box/LRR-repeat protein 23 n=1 Tax=Rutidosis leptorrhynchoides TaxID=125765 RepID=UPI003A9929C6